MDRKFFEIRDRMTFIPAVAFLLSGEDSWLVRRAGFGSGSMVVLMRLTDCEAQYDPYGWSGGTRTMPEAHWHIQEHWDELKDGDLIDVEYILGESQAQKESER